MTSSAEIIGLAVVVAFVLVVAAIFLRRTLLARSGGINLCWRWDLRGGQRGWVFGQGRFSDTGLALYRSFSPLPVPSSTLDREHLALGPRRSPAPAEMDLLPVGSVIVRCTGAGVRPFEIALSEQGLTGLRSWLESVPPAPTRGVRGR